jgi:hypothetical protein
VTFSLDFDVLACTQLTHSCKVLKDKVVVWDRDKRMKRSQHIKKIKYEIATFDLDDGLSKEWMAHL